MMHTEVEVNGLLRPVLGFGIENGGCSLLLKWRVLRYFGWKKGGLLFESPKLSRGFTGLLEDSRGLNTKFIVGLHSNYSFKCKGLTWSCSSLTVLKTEGLIVGNCILSGKDDVAESNGLTLGRKR